MQQISNGPLAKYIMAEIDAVKLQVAQRAAANQRVNGGRRIADDIECLPRCKSLVRQRAEKPRAVSMSVVPPAVCAFPPLLRHIDLGSRHRDIYWETRQACQPIEIAYDIPRRMGIVQERCQSRRRCLELCDLGV